MRKFAAAREHWRDEARPDPSMIAAVDAFFRRWVLR